MENGQEALATNKGFTISPHQTSEEVSPFQRVGHPGRATCNDKTVP